jgi:hypothetical protein
MPGLQKAKRGIKKGKEKEDKGRAVIFSEEIWGQLGCIGVCSY